MKKYNIIEIRQDKETMWIGALDTYTHTQHVLLSFTSILYTLMVLLVSSYNTIDCDKFYKLSSFKLCMDMTTFFHFYLYYVSTMLLLLFYQKHNLNSKCFFAPFPFTIPNRKVIWSTLSYRICIIMQSSFSLCCLSLLFFLYQKTTRITMNKSYFPSSSSFFAPWKDIYKKNLLFKIF